VSVFKDLFKPTGPGPSDIPADPALDISQAILRVLTERFGPEFAKDVRLEIEREMHKAVREYGAFGEAMATATKEVTLGADIWDELESSPRGRETKSAV
jgi:hypothetical protein